MIDSINILQATMQAMQQAVQRLRPLPDFVLIDGTQLPRVRCLHNKWAIAHVGQQTQLAGLAHDRYNKPGTDVPACKICMLVLAATPACLAHRDRP